MRPDLNQQILSAEQDVFGERLQRRTVRTTRRSQAVDRLAQIQEGDFLVHAEHGIGRYGGLAQAKKRDRAAAARG